MKKIQFCCGQTKLEGWENYDKEIDISKPLNFDNDSIDFIFIEHGIEHIQQMSGVDFLKECYRILKLGGTMRITFPDICKIYNNPLCHNRMAYIEKTHSRININNALKSTMYSWGHKSFWSLETMICALVSANFYAYVVQSGKSAYKELDKIESHYKLRSNEKWFSEPTAKMFEDLHTSSVEAVKIYDKNDPF